MFYAPLEQFQIIPFVSINFFSINVSLSNLFFMNLTVLLCYLCVILLNSSQGYLQEISFYLVSNAWQRVIEFFSEIVSQLISDVIFYNKNKYIPIIFMFFHFILLSNLLGLIPYSFTATSHIIITFSLSLSIFIGVNLITYQKYGIKSFALFLPANTPFFLALLLVPIEFISYFARPVSLGVRLFVNLMAGHSLLKVIVGFSWGMMLVEKLASFGLILPTVVLMILFVLELGVAIIQTYVFIILTCMYIQDAN